MTFEYILRGILNEDILTSSDKIQFLSWPPFSVNCVFGKLFRGVIA